MISQRALMALMVLAAGVALMIVSYFLLATPWGFPPESEDFSNPRVVFAPLIFIVGVIMVFGSAIVYELWPERRRG
jgi:hypothetical protein